MVVLNLPAHSLCVCNYCGKTSLHHAEINFKRCGACSQAYYCSAPCQRADWKADRHKGVCRRDEKMIQQSESLALANPSLHTLVPIFNKYLDVIAAPVRTMLDSAFRAQDGAESLKDTHYLSTAWTFNPLKPDLRSQFDLLTIDLFERATAPAAYKSALDPKAVPPGSVTLIATIVLSTGKQAGTSVACAISYALLPYREAGWNPYPYDEGWREGFISELKSPNPWDDYLIVTLQRINHGAASKVDRKRAELGLRYRYPEARGQLWETQKYTQEEIKEAERLGYGQPIKK